MKAMLSRKFILSMAAILTTSGLCVFGYIDEGVYSAVVIATVGAYITGNVIQKSTARVDQPEKG